MTLRERLRNWLIGPLEPVAPPAPPPAMKIDALTLAAIGAPAVDHEKTWTAYRPPAGVAPAGLAMDDMPALANSANLYAWAMTGAFSEGLGFLGYPYLAELSQRPEYRHVVTVYASEVTRQWIKLTGADDDKLDELRKAMAEFRVQQVFREIAEHDGFFGRGQIFMDFGDFDNPDELAKPLVIDGAKIGKGKLKNLKPVEPIWSYPGKYNSSNPLAPDFYLPREWYVMGKIVDSSRLLTFVSREMPDMLKPAYAFGGVAMTQMIKPYVDNWLSTRQAVADLIKSFSTMILGTDMDSVLSGGTFGAAQTLATRMDLFNRGRSNRGLMVVDKTSEELTNVSTPLGSLPELQAQTQEHIASISGIPLVILLGVTPSGLNASSDGEIRAFYDKIASWQERVFREPLQTVINVIQLHLWGSIDPAIGFDFNPLWEMSAIDNAAVEKSNADVDNGYVDRGVLDPVEVRERLAADPNGRYRGIKASAAPALDEPDADDAP